MPQTIVLTGLSQGQATDFERNHRAMGATTVTREGPDVNDKYKVTATYPDPAPGG
jgi:hypothetical protein